MKAQASSGPSSSGFSARGQNRGGYKRKGSPSPGWFRKKLSSDSQISFSSDSVASSSKDFGK